MAKILIVEDEEAVATLLSTVLSAERHLVEVISDGDEALMVLRNSGFDVVILDLTLPHLDGMEVCRQYRAGGGDVPILMLTARGDVDDRATGLDAGADDYLVKPFHLKELSARIRALLRRSAVKRADIITSGRLELDLRTRRVHWCGHRLSLVPKEFEILSFLVRHEGEAYSAEQILQRVWPSDADVLPVTIRTHIKNIRRKAAEFGDAELIHHIPGVGYCFEAESCSMS